MNLRNEQVPLMCKVDGTKVEEFFEKKNVAAKYNEAVESARFKERLAETLENFAEAVKKIQEDKGENKRLESITSKENVMDNVRINVMVNAISLAAEAIIFDGKDSETAVAEIITPDFVFEILDGVSNVIAEECASVVVAQTFSDALIKGFEELLS